MHRRHSDETTPFDLHMFMRVCCFAPWDGGPDDTQPAEQPLWWNRVNMRFGRVGEQWFFDDATEHVRWLAPWPTSFEEAFETLVRWDCELEENRAVIWEDYEHVRQNLRWTCACELCQCCRHRSGAEALASRGSVP